MGCGSSHDDLRSARLAARARGGLSGGGAMTPSPGNSFLPSQIPTIIVTPPSLLPPSPAGMMIGPPPPQQQQHQHAQSQPEPPPPHHHHYHPHQPMHSHSHSHSPSPIRVDTGPAYDCGDGCSGPSCSSIVTTPVVMSAHHSFSECTSPISAGGSRGAATGTDAAALVSSSGAVVSAAAVAVGVGSVIVAGSGVGHGGGGGPSSRSSAPSASSPHSSLSILTAVQSANRANALASAQDGGMPRHIIHPPRGGLPMHPESPSVKPRSTYLGGRDGRRSVDGDVLESLLRGGGGLDRSACHRDVPSLDAYDPEAEHRIFQFRDNEHVQIPGVALGAGLSGGESPDARMAEEQFMQRADRERDTTPTSTFERRVSSRAGSQAPSPTSANAAAAGAGLGLGLGAVSSATDMLRGRQQQQQQQQQSAPRLALSEVHG